MDECGSSGYTTLSVLGELYLTYTEVGVVISAGSRRVWGLPSFNLRK